MEDHHVDRPEVEAEQSAQLTGTNRSIGLDRRRNKCSAANRPRAAAKPSFPAPAGREAQTTSPQDTSLTPVTLQMPPPGHASQGQGFAGLVAMARGQTPDPIPNSAVKTLSADGTAAQAAEE